MAALELESVRVDVESEKYRLDRPDYGYSARRSMVRIDRKFKRSHCAGTGCRSHFGLWPLPKWRPHGANPTSPPDQEGQPRCLVSRLFPRRLDRLSPINGGAAGSAIRADTHAPDVSSKSRKAGRGCAVEMLSIGIGKPMVHNVPLP